MRGRLLLSVVVVLVSFTAFVSTQAQSGRADSVRRADTTKRSHAEIDELSLEWFKLSNRNPAITLSGGLTSFARKDLSAPVPDALALGIELGFRRGNTAGISSMSRNHEETIYFTYYKGTEVTSPTLQIPETINGFRFGAASRNGYGYKFGSGIENITFIHGKSGLSWTIFNVSEDSAAFAANQPLATFGSSIRFGEAWMPAIDLRVAGPLSLQLQYTWNQVYPRHMFWYWAGSGVVEGLADAATVWFVREIAQSSPTVTPIMYFLLRNAVSASFKALRMNRMNWPFNTDAPLNMHTFSVGATVIF